jgi:ABC-type phosphate transport system substrate-binding protein
MKKLAIVLCLAIAVVAMAACGNGSEMTGGESKGDPLLTQSAGDVASIVIYDQSTSQAITLIADSDQMKPLAQALESTKTQTMENPTSDSDMQLSDPKYMLEVNYTDNKLDNIFSTETGQTYFRFINDDNGWVGGENKDAMKIIEGLFAVE